MVAGLLAAAAPAAAGQNAPGDAATTPTRQAGDLKFQADSGLVLTILGQVRVRHELLDDLYRPDDPGGVIDSDFTLLRTRIGFQVDVDEHLGAVVELQDVRRFGEEGSTTADTEGVDLKRGFLAVRDLLDRPVDLELGRWVMAYGDERLIGALEWANQGRSYDGLRVTTRPTESTFVDLFGVKIRDAPTTDEDQSLVGIYAGSDGIVEGHRVEGYVLWLGDGMERDGEDGPGDTSFVTVGTRLAGARDALDYTAELAVQTGDLAGDDLGAWGLALTAGYSFEEFRYRPRVGVELDHASGDEDPLDGETEQFQTLFPTNHRHYGYADLVGWSNMTDLKGTVSIRPHDEVTATLDFHHLSLAESSGAWVHSSGRVVRPGSPGSPTGLADELDLTVSWRPDPALALLVGWSHVWSGDFIEATGPATGADFAYAQAWLRF